MEPWIAVALILCVFGLLAGVLVRDWLETRRIRNVFWSLANQLGMNLTGFRLFTLGIRPVLTPIRRAKGSDSDTASFRYSYVIPGKYRRTVSQTIVWMRFRGGVVPDFAIQPQPKRHWLLSDVTFGARDIDFESHPEFSRTFLLRGRDESAIRDLFKPDVLEFFEAHAGLSVEAADDQLIYYRHSECVLPDDVPDLIEEARELRARLEASVRPDG